MLESALASMGWVVSNYLNAGVTPVPMGNENFTAAPSGTFPTADGLLNIAANETYQFEKLCDLLGRPELKTDPRFCDRDIRKENRAAINREVRQGLAKRSAAEWEALLTTEGVPAGRVLGIPEILAHAHLTERQFVATFTTPTGTHRVTRGGFTLPDDPTAPSQPAPLLSEHTETWLGKLGYDPEKVVELRNQGVI
jgi:crotonobetainyl-CoA:carnitine CoA-transferase CaiB-like acyl-CoA transferase